jgi:hypothetical protein
MTLATANLIIFFTLGVLILAFMFARQIETIINFLLNLTPRHAGVRVMARRQFVDVETGAPFEVWNGVSGIRLAIVSAILKF